MNEMTEILINTELFCGIPQYKILSMFKCLGCTKRDYSAGETVMRAYQRVQHIGIVVTGRVHACISDFWGNSSIISEYTAGESFGEAYALAKDDFPVYDVVAKVDSTIMFVDINKILSPCENNCHEHRKLIENLLTAVATKSRSLETKMSHICCRTTRDKLLSYLSAEARKHAKNSFVIPFNRQELADYLSVERCAMSKELQRMKRDGLIDFSKSRFELKSSN